MNGFINILKPPGMTSHDVVSYVRRLLGIKKVGHTGTLDPGAAGVLLVCCGKATRLIEYLDQTKRYRTEITFGVSSSTGDSFGELSYLGVPAEFSQKQVMDVLPIFTGNIAQIPPMTSAVRHQGKKLYELARRGVEVERLPRVITVYSIEMIHWHQGDEPRALLDICCSAGTYIRTLCEDIGRELGCGAYMSFLLRTGVGSNSIEHSVSLEELKVAVQEDRQFLICLEEAMSFLPKVIIWEGAVKSVSSGGTLFMPGVRGIFGDITPDDIVLLMGNSGVLGIGRAVVDSKGRMSFKPEKILT